MTVFKEAGQLLRIFIGETNKYGRMPLYEWIVQQARSQGMAGATVLRQSIEKEPGADGPSLPPASCPTC